jgi:aspartate aminotransferase
VLRQGRIEDRLAMLRAKLLSEARVVVVPGEAFGTDEHIRLSYATTPAQIDKGVERIKKFFGEL